MKIFTGPKFVLVLWHQSTRLNQEWHQEKHLSHSCVLLESEGTVLRFFRRKKKSAVDPHPEKKATPAVPHICVGRTRETLQRIIATLADEPPNPSCNIDSFDQIRIIGGNAFQVSALCLSIPQLAASLKTNRHCLKLAWRKTNRQSRWSN